MLPPSTNAAYRGHIAAAYLLGFMALYVLVPGGLHYFLPDGGAGSIAGLDLSQNGAVLLSTFAWVGATQMVWGVTLLAVATRYRSFLRAAACLLLVERGLMVFSMWGFKSVGGAGSDKPPGAYGVLIAVALAVIVIYLARPKDR